MEYSLKYGKTAMKVDIKEENLLGVLHANEVSIGSTGVEEVQRAMDNPIKSKRLHEIVKPGERVAIITSDITRPMPSRLVLPVVLDELHKAGVKDKDIVIVFALGSHRKHTKEEQKYLVGEDIYNLVRCVDSTDGEFVHYGYTDNNTPIDISSFVAEADRRICLGNIEYHYFAGYSGGAKAIMPGVSSRTAIQANHSKMVDKNSYAGNLDTNPVRKDIEEAVRYIPIDFIVNVVLDEKKEIIKAVAGHYIHGHRDGCKFLDSLFKLKIKEKADIVITSPGGFPKDINLYQAQKALDNAKHAVVAGGIIILAASCKEGLGEKTFEEWILTAMKPEELIERIRKDFMIGGHKAAAIALVLQTVKVYLVSDLSPELVKQVFFEPFDNIQTAMEHAYNELGSDSKVLLIPNGGLILTSCQIG